MKRKSVLSAALALTAVSACFLFAPRPTHASNNGGPIGNRPPVVRPLPDLAITDVEPVYTKFTIYQGYDPAPDQLWVKVSNIGAAASPLPTTLNLAWGPTVWGSEGEDPDLDYEAVDPIPAGGYEWVKVHTNGYDLWSQGAVYFLYVNYHRDFAESDYTNNTYYSP